MFSVFSQDVLYWLCQVWVFMPTFLLRAWNIFEISTLCTCAHVLPSNTTSETLCKKGRLTDPCLSRANTTNWCRVHQIIATNSSIPTSSSLLNVRDKLIDKMGPVRSTALQPTPSSMNIYQTDGSANENQSNCQHDPQTLVFAISFCWAL